MSMQSDDIREEIFKAINVLVKESLSKMDYLFLVEGVIENKDDFNRVYSFSYNGESHTAVSLTGEDFIEGDSVYVLFSNDRDIKKMIVGKRNRYASWAPIDQIPQIEGPAGKTSYTHIAYADSATGEGMSSSPVGKSYMGMYVDLIKEGSLDPSKYGWVLIKGSDGAPGSQGPQGVQGPAGKDGKATYTWIRYADTSTGGGISNSPTGKEYIGLAHNKETSTESNTPTDYTWSLIRGPQGESGNTGVEGPKGKDGKTTYTWIKYSANANGSGLTDTPQADTAYIGIATNKTVQDESSTPGDYIWSLFKGPKGEAGEVGPRGLQGQQGPEGKQGIQGSKGADGLSSYTHIAYATGTQGQGFNHETFPEATYIGMYVSSDQDSSGSWSDYEWTLVKGKDGSQGLRGPEGKDGKTPYFHTAWANDQTGTSGFSTTDSVDKIYIGTATTFESNDPTEPSAYNWTKIKGDKGDQGPKGATGAVGPRGDAGTSVEGIVEYYGLSTSDTVKPTSWVEVKSEATPLPKMTSVNKYLWNYEKINFSDSTSQNTIPVVVGAYGDTGQTGQTGSTGSAGVDGRSIVSIKDKYLVTSVSSGVTRSTSGWVDAPTATDDTNKYLWNYEIITWNKAPITTYVDPIIIGVHGLKGDTGEKGATGVQGPRGATGTSVESVTEYYLATSASSGILSTNPGFTTAIQTMTATNKYLWNYEKINFSDNTSQPTVPVIIGVYGDKGSTGSTGATGRSITGITEHYLASDLATGVTRSTSGWSTTMQPTTESKRYLWNYETITWSSGTMTTYVEPIVIGVHGLQGPKGDTGPKGATGSTGPKGDVGTSVSSVTEYYLASPASSGILATNPGFTTTMQPMTLTNKYLWNYEKINFSDGTDQPTIPVVIGVYGDRGPTGGIGPTGRSIVSVTEHYLATSANTGVTRSTSGWNTTMQPTTETNKYLWNYETVTWSATPLTTYVDPIIIGVHGAKGDKGDSGENAKLLYLSSNLESMIFNSDNTPNPLNQTATIEAKLQNVSGTIVYSATAYNGATSIGNVVLGGTGNVKTLSINNFPVNASHVSVTATLDSLTDTISIFKIRHGEKGFDGTDGTDGQNAIVGILTNESIAVPASENGTVTSFTGATGIFEVYDGTTRKTGSGVAYSVSGTPSGITVSINATTGAYTVSAMTSGTSVLSGNATLQAVYNGVTIKKVLTVTKAMTGKTGATGGTGASGSNAKIVTLTSSAQIFAKNASGVVSPASITVEGTSQNTSISAWEYSVDGGTFSSSLPTGLSRTGNVVSITGSSVTAKSISLRAKDASGVSDVLSIAVVQDGAKGDTGAKGATGSQGPKGATGTSVSSVTEYYLATSASSGVTASTSGWTETIQTMTATNKYLWNYEQINFSDGTNQPTLPVIIGAYGDKGQTGSTGATGRSITGITEHYLVSNLATGVTRTTSGWTTTMQQTDPTKKYLWNYETITWSSGTTTTYVEPIVIGIHGAQGVKGDTGSDAYTVVLSNEAHTFAGNTASAIASSVTVNVVAYKGATRVGATIGTISGAVEGMGTSIATNGTTTASFTVSVTAAMSTTNGLLTIPITVDGKLFNKTFSFALALKGADGANGSAGANAKVIIVNPSAQIFTKDANGNITPSTITVDGTAQNVTISTWEYSIEGGAFSTSLPAGLTRSGNKVTITGSSMTAKNISVRASGSGVSDTTTIAMVQDGAKGSTGSTGAKGDNSIVGYLTNESVTLGASSTGVVSSFTTASGTFRVFDGITEVTTNSACVFSLNSSTGVTLTINSSGVYTVTAMSADTATAEFKAVYKGITITKSMSLSKSRVGVTGGQGAKGDKGATGEKGATGSIGPQGATGTSVESIVEYYGLSTSASTKPTSWTEIVSPSTPFPVMTATNKYLWNYEKIKFSDLSTQDTLPVVVGVYGDKGATGSPGDTGSPGVDGRSITSIQEKYQVNNLASGVTRATGTWINTPTATSDSNKYLWNYEIVNWNKAPTPTYVDPIIIGVHGNKGDKGATGETGIAGPKGDNGLPTYTWIAYASSATGTGISLSPAGKDYVGYASGQTSKTPSITTPSLYTWQLVKGATGPQGIQGGVGPKGDPVYTWIKYADTPTSGMTDDPTDKKYIGMAHNKPSEDESTDYSDYTWSLMPQNIEVGGRNFVLSSATLHEFDETHPTSTTYYDEVERFGYDLTVGGRNLLRNSKTLFHALGDNSLPIGVPSDELPAGVYTISFDYEVSDAGGNPSDFLLYSDASITRVPLKKEGESRTSHTFTLTEERANKAINIYFGSGSAESRLNEGTFYELKLEKGSIVTQWSPAPEDFNNLKGIKYSLSQSLETNKQYTLAVDGLFNDFVGVWLGDDVHLGYLKDNKLTFKLTETFGQNRIILKSMNEYGEIERVKLERGSIATDWTAAPEDISQEIEDAVGNAKDEVMDLVTTNYATTTLLSDSITNEVTARTEMRDALVEEIASQVKQSADSFDVIFKKIEEDQGLDREEIELIQSYFRINENGVIIGKSNSAIEFFAENNRVGFRDEILGDIAYWEEGTMHVDRLIAITTIMVGYHLIEKYDSPVAGKTTIVRIGD